MKRTALELSQAFRDTIASQNEDDIARLLEDINDSVGEIDTANYVERQEYERAIADRDKFEAQAKDYRDRYINRFYQPGKEPNDQTYINSTQNQAVIQAQEKEYNYDNIWD